MAEKKPSPGSERMGTPIHFVKVDPFKDRLSSHIKVENKSPEFQMGYAACGRGEKRDMAQDIQWLLGWDKRHFEILDEEDKKAEKGETP